uniref:Uncharacterized protein n=1 Tax=Chelonoidis abingdonii TaxID=106734 RepID=A0A8C0GFI9_CHEAB
MLIQHFQSHGPFAERGPRPFSAGTKLPALVGTALWHYGAVLHGWEGPRSPGALQGWMREPSSRVALLAQPCPAGTCWHVPVGLCWSSCVPASGPGSCCLSPADWQVSQHLQQASQAHEAESSRLSQQVSSKRATLAQTARELEQARQELGQARQELGQAREELERMQLEMNGTQEKLLQREAVLEGTKEELARVQEEKREIKEKLNQTKSALSSIRPCEQTGTAFPGRGSVGCPMLRQGQLSPRGEGREHPAPGPCCRTGLQSLCTRTDPAGSFWGSEPDPCLHFTPRPASSRLEPPPALSQCEMELVPPVHGPFVILERF